MLVQPESSVKPESEDAAAVAIEDINNPAAWCSCTTESLLCSAGKIIVLRVEGEIDLCTLPILRAALDDSLDQDPDHLVVDLARMTFCFVRGLALIAHAGHTAAEKVTGYAVSAVPPQVDRVWALLWEGDLPVRYRSAAAAVTAIRAAG